MIITEIQIQITDHLEEGEHAIKWEPMTRVHCTSGQLGQSAHSIPAQRWKWTMSWRKTILVRALLVHCLVSRPLDDLCSWYLYFCVDHLSTQISERQGTAICTIHCCTPSLCWSIQRANGQYRDRQSHTGCTQPHWMLPHFLGWTMDIQRCRNLTTDGQRNYLGIFLKFITSLCMYTYFSTSEWIWYSIKDLVNLYLLGIEKNPPYVGTNVQDWSYFLWLPIQIILGDANSEAI